MIAIMAPPNQPGYPEMTDYPELWFSHEFLDRLGPPWSMRLDSTDPLTDESPWRFGLDVFIGAYVRYEVMGLRRIWRIVGVNPARDMLIGRWPD